MPLSAPEWWWHTATGALAVPLSAVRRYGAETAAVAAVVALLGALCTTIDSYVPWLVTPFPTTTMSRGRVTQYKGMDAITCRVKKVRVEPKPAKPRFCSYNSRVFGALGDSGLITMSN